MKSHSLSPAIGLRPSCATQLSAPDRLRSIRSMDGLRCNFGFVQDLAGHTRGSYSHLRFPYHCLRHKRRTSPNLVLQWCRSTSPPHTAGTRSKASPSESLNLPAGHPLHGHFQTLRTCRQCMGYTRVVHRSAPAHPRTWNTLNFQRLQSAPRGTSHTGFDLR